MRSAVKRYILSKPKLRQSWNKFNLYNLSKYSATIPRSNRTFFQQKWQAKQALRAYHGEHIGEKRWTRLFSRRLTGAVEMPPQYLAAYDGSEQATGRGSGRQVNPDDLNARPAVTAADFSHIEQVRLAKEKEEEAAAKNNKLRWPSPFLKSRVTRDRPGDLLSKPISKMTPYMHMTFAPMERRLDIAMFRAMFASSPRQARQFCIHGGVTVNGKKMRYGAYLLNPGDMFQVDPDKVMYATGRPKTIDNLVRDPKRKKKTEEEEEEASSEDSEPADEDPLAAEAAAKAATPTPTPTAEPSKVKISPARSFMIIRRLLESAKVLQTQPDLNAKDKQQLRAFLAAARRAIRHTATSETSESDLINELSSLIGRFKISENEIVKIPTTTHPTTARYEEPTQFSPFENLLPAARKRAETLSRENKLSFSEQKALAQMMESAESNPYDPSKPYRTPWEPRRFLAPFTFIPRYLEVNQNICSAIYVRHPVARKGMTEVPTPFPYEFSQLAFNWYLRRS